MPEPKILTFVEADGITPRYIDEVFADIVEPHIDGDGWCEMSEGLLLDLLQNAMRFGRIKGREDSNDTDLTPEDWDELVTPV